MIRWTGYGVSEEARIVLPFRSSHSDRRGVDSALQRAADEAYGFAPISELHVWRADSPEGERYDEAAQEAARDFPGGIPAQVLHTADLEPSGGLSAVGDAVRASGLPRSMVSQLFDAMQAVNGMEADEGMSQRFGSMVERMAAYGY